jgi:hypothetical protein
VELLQIVVLVFQVVFYVLGIVSAIKYLTHVDVRTK